jgi:hypothetical protein
MIMRPLGSGLAFGFLVILGGCTSPKADVDASLDAAFACMHHQAPLLDDHISDVTAVAYGLTSACNAAIANSIDLSTNGMLLQEYPRAKVRMEETMLHAATEIVLQERAGR